MLSDRLKKLIEESEMRKAAEDFWMEIEKEAEKYEVTVDYYLAEFY